LSVQLRLKLPSSMVSIFKGIDIQIYNRGNHLQGWHEYHEWTIVKNHTIEIS
jgi:hypothetical protein